MGETHPRMRFGKISIISNAILCVTILNLSNDLCIYFLSCIADKLKPELNIKNWISRCS